ncbi:MAG: FumA C-terminus/TtdB family hydratase beta subunit [Desulfomonilia bacterium]|jgi:tartrate/fumarate subfamily iron-sulfur-dependent hydro-lyase beta chain|uniref:Tartrate dehydratase beta subunit/Fumarate hydratase class I, C-terminal domain n=1 Tax=anaerobic digester metagenome TaxID=1263854 RepID=A0A485LVA5_9ZZZZ|nr:FumA C-terminus/TtdB family hydratase beta subunit [Pseudomonadota bacterium]HON38901.1 FumA C-terminus/TtdB family hydratase beta subunit [Deltaproteobacteria bacterium]HRS56344.1 FumA C-terminus/TtdB family hydratase beta subunit [Desulfomonilia bacterium]HPD20903.1 FumA C-terminus/TtdB family hydratase beta subunit [Deltaproteobacteria bacterium]HPX17730.1 FumA C-terminus/TtdB family hydratase beta subunit [Deltaproteobacteria bacterium]
MALIPLTSPLSTETARSLNAGDQVRLSGRIVTARDQVHQYLASGGNSPVDLGGLVIYHCGPVTIRQGDTWRVTAAGPTTSMREEPYEARVIRTHRPGAIMGKGGMGEATRAALQSEGCVYLHLAGGAAAFIARRIVAVEEVHLLEFGMPEAMWVFRVEDLPALVTMDAHGRSLHSDIEHASHEILKRLLNTPFSS